MIKAIYSINGSRNTVRFENTRNTCVNLLDHACLVYGSNRFNNSNSCLFSNRLTNRLRLRTGFAVRHDFQNVFPCYCEFNFNTEACKHTVDRVSNGLRHDGSHRLGYVLRIGRCRVHNLLFKLYENGAQYTEILCIIDLRRHDERIERDDASAGFDQRVFKRKVERARHRRILVLHSKSSLFRIGHLLVFKNGTERQTIQIGKPELPTQGSKETSLDIGKETVAGNGINVRNDALRLAYIEAEIAGEFFFGFILIVVIVTENVYHAFNGIRFRIIEVSVSVKGVAGRFHSGGKSGNKCVEGPIHKVNDIAERGFSDSFNLISISVHQSNLDDLYVGVDCKNLIDNADIVDKIAREAVKDDVGQRIHSVLFTAGKTAEFFMYVILDLRDKITDLLFKRGIQLCKRKNVLYVVSVAENFKLAFRSAENLHDRRKHKSTKVGITERKRDNIRIFYGLLIKFRRDLEISISADLLALIFICRIVLLFTNTLNRVLNFLFARKGGLEKALVFILAVGCKNSCRAVCITVVAVTQVCPRAEVTYLEAPFSEPKVLDYLFPAVVRGIPLVVNGFHKLAVFIVKLQKPMQVLCAHTAHCELSVVNGRKRTVEDDLIVLDLTRIARKPCRELVGISVFRVVHDTAVTVVTIQAVAVGHRVTDRYIDELVFFRITHRDIDFSRADNGRAHAEKHDQRHEYGKHLHAHFLKFHVLFLSEVISSKMKIV